MESPREIHMEALMKIVGYIKRTKDYKIIYNGNNKELVAYIDASYNISDENNKSVTGMVILLAGAPIHWISKRQTVNTNSTMDSELTALNTTLINVLNFKYLLNELDWKIKLPTIIYEDNNPLICRIQNKTNYTGEQKLSRQFNNIISAVNSKEVEVKKVDTVSQLADIFTKSVGKIKFIPIRQLLNIRKITENPLNDMEEC